MIFITSQRYYCPQLTQKPLSHEWPIVSTTGCWFEPAQLIMRSFVGGMCRWWLGITMITWISDGNGLWVTPWTQYWCGTKCPHLLSMYRYFHTSVLREAVFVHLWLPKPFQSTRATEHWCQSSLVQSDQLKTRHVTLHSALLPNVTPPTTHTISF